MKIGLRGVSRGFRIVPVLASILFYLLFLSLDEAGRESYRIPFAGGPVKLGGARAIALTAPAGTYDVFASVRGFARTPGRVALTVGSHRLEWRRIRIMGLAIGGDVFLGSLAIPEGAVPASMEVAEGNGDVLSVTLEPTLYLGLTRDLLQRIAAALSIAFLFVAAPRALLRRPWLLYALLLLAMLARLSCFGLVPFMGDMRAHLLPFHELSQREIAAGRIPLWNPHTYLGMPHLANMTTQIGYPPAAVCLILGLSYATREAVVWFLSFLLAATGTALLARRLGVSPLGATLAGLLFMLSPWLWNWPYPAVYCTAAIMPWMLYFVLLRRGMMGVALSLLAGFVAGHLQVFSYVVLALAIVLAIPPIPRIRALPWPKLAIGSVLGILLGSFVGMPFLEFGALSTRSRGLSTAHAALGSFSISSVAAALPHGIDGRWVARIQTERRCTDQWVGLLGLPLVAAALMDLFRRRHRRVVLTFGIICLAGIALALGDLGPFSPYVLMQHVPLFSGQRGPGRALVITTFALCLLAGRGLDVLRLVSHRPRSARVIRALAALVLVTAIGLCAHERVLDRQVWSGVAFQGGLLLLLTAALARAPRSLRRLMPYAIVAVMAIDRFDDVWGARPGAWPSVYRIVPATSHPPGPSLRELPIIFCENDAIVTRRLSAWGGYPVIPMRTALTFNLLKPGLFRFDRAGRLSSVSPTLLGPELFTPRAVEVLELLGVHRILVLRKTVPPIAPELVQRLRPVRKVWGLLELVLPQARRARIVPEGAAVSSMAYAEQLMRVSFGNLELLPGQVEMREAGEKIVEVAPGPRGWDELSIWSFTGHGRRLPSGTEVGRVRVYEGGKLLADVPLRLGIETADAEVDDPTQPGAPGHPKVEVAQSYDFEREGHVFKIYSFATHVPLPHGARPDRFVVTRPSGPFTFYLRQVVLSPKAEPESADIPLVVEGPAAPQGGRSRAVRGEPLVRDVDPGEVDVMLPRHGPGYLLLADAFFPGWEARVDGVQRSILPADLALRAVRLAGGEREVVFRYRPFSFRLGLYGSLVGLVVTLLAAVRRRV